MRWILVVFVFGLTPDNQPTDGAVYYKSFASQPECDVVGQNFRDVFSIPSNRKSTSVCLPESALRETEWRLID